MPERGQALLDAFCDAATYRRTGAPLLACAGAIRTAKRGGARGGFVAEVRSQAEAQRRFRKASA